MSFISKFLGRKGGKQSATNTQSQSSAGSLQDDVGNHGLLERFWNDGDVVPDTITGVLDTMVDATDFLADELVEPAVDKGTALIGAGAADVLDLFGVDPDTQEGVSGFLSGLGDSYVDFSNDAQVFSQNMTEPLGDIITKYTYQGVNNQFLDGTPEAPTTKGKKGGRRFGVFSVGGAKWFGESLLDVVDAGGQAYTQTFGSDDEGFEEAMDIAKHDVLDPVMDWALKPGEGLATHTYEKYPDLGDGGDIDAPPNQTMLDVVGAGHSFLDHTTQTATHLLGYGTTALGHFNRVLGDAGQSGANRLIDLAQFMGFGPDEEDQAQANITFDATQDCQTEMFAKGAEFLHNLADPLGDAIADSGTKLGVGVIQDLVDWGQIGGNIVFDLYQASNNAMNEVKQSNGEGVTDEEQAQWQAAGDANQARVNSSWDTTQSKRDNAVEQVVKPD